MCHTVYSGRLLQASAHVMSYLSWDLRQLLCIWVHRSGWQLLLCRGVGVREALVDLVRQQPRGALLLGQEWTGELRVEAHHLRWHDDIGLEKRVHEGGALKRLRYSIQESVQKCAYCNSCSAT